jgi:hypothetical protein
MPSLEKILYGEREVSMQAILLAEKEAVLSTDDALYPVS